MLLVAPSWVKSKGEELFRRGARSPIDDPVFGTYLAQGRFYDSTFERFRETYVAAARTVLRDQPKEASGPGDSAGEGLVRHVLIAIIRGLLDVTDADDLASLTFGNAHPKDIAHGYWEICRGWSDSKDPIPGEYVGRLVNFWDWRMKSLEGVPDSPTRQEEAEGMLWLFMVPQIPAALAIQLGLRSFRLNTGHGHTRGDIWERIAEVGAADVALTCECVEILVNQELTLGYGHLPFDRVGPALKVVLGGPNLQLRDRIVRLVHRLGESGHTDFRQLLPRDVIEG